MTVNGVKALLEANVKKAGGADALAANWEISATYIRMVLGDRAAPGKLILSRLGLERVTSYRIKKEVRA